MNIDNEPRTLYGLRGECGTFLVTSLDVAAKECVEESVEKRLAEKEEREKRERNEGKENREGKSGESVVERIQQKRKYAALKKDQNNEFSPTEKLVWDLPRHVVEQQITLLSAATKNDPIFANIAKTMMRQAHKPSKDKTEVHVSTHNSKLADVKLKHAMDFVLQVLKAMNDRHDLEEGKIDSISLDDELPIPLRISKKDFDEADISRCYRDFKKLNDALIRQGEGTKLMETMLSNDLTTIRNGLNTLFSVSESLGFDHQDSTIATLKAVIHVLYAEFQKNIMPSIPRPMDLESPGRNPG